MTEETRTRTAHGGDYLTELADRLRAAGVAEHRITATVEELTDHLAHSGTTPEEEFGPLPEFAAQLGEQAAVVADAPHGEPAADAEEWRWAADTYVDRALLNRYGAEGWEVERIDRLGRFVARRDTGRALSWEYRRAVVPRRQRTAHAARLAPDGWEPCGHWMYIAYYKRPLSATAGPEAELTELPAGPGRSWFFGRRMYILLAVGALSLVVLAALLAAGGGDTGMWVGVLVGAAAGGLVGAWAVRRDVKREVSDSI